MRIQKPPKQHAHGASQIGKADTSAARPIPTSAHAGPSVESRRLTGRLESRPLSVLATRFYAVAYSEILEGKLALSIAERTTAAKTGQLDVCRRSFDAHNFVLRLAIRASKGIRRGVCHRWNHSASLG